jgi:hypothetical protein
MEITIFKSITTESVLAELEASAEKYDGLYCDMEDSEQRKFVKGKASLINGMLKNLDRKRIDESKRYKVEVEKEAGLIKQRLDAANAPFTFLINKYSRQRADILAQQKAVDDAKALEAKKENDHESAIMHDKIHDMLKREAVHSQLLHEEEIRKAAVKEEHLRIVGIERERLYKEESRKTDIEHVTSTCKAAKESLMQHANLTEEQAIEAVKAIRKNLIQNVQIKF